MNKLTKMVILGFGLAVFSTAGYAAINEGIIRHEDDWIGLELKNKDGLEAKGSFLAEDGTKVYFQLDSTGYSINYGNDFVLKYTYNSEFEWERNRTMAYDSDWALFDENSDGYTEILIDKEDNKIYFRKGDPVFETLKSTEEYEALSRSYDELFDTADELLYTIQDTLRGPDFHRMWEESFKEEQAD